MIVYEEEKRPDDDPGYDDNTTAFFRDGIYPSGSLDNLGEPPDYGIWVWEGDIYYTIYDGPDGREDDMEADGEFRLATVSDLNALLDYTIKEQP